MAKKKQIKPRTGPKLTHIAPEIRRFAVPVTSIKADPENARLHPERNLDAIVASLKQFGQQKPIVLTTAGVVLAGNGMLAAATRLDWKHIAAVKTNLKGQKGKAFALADNRTSDLSEFDDELLAEQLAELDDADFDIESVGFTAEELAALSEEADPASSDYAEAGEQTGTASKKTQHPGINFIVGDFRFSISRRKYATWLKDVKLKGGEDTISIIGEIRRRLKL